MLVLAGATVAGVLWLPQLDSSFWLDETGTAWLTQGSLFDTMGRAVRYQGGAPLFLALEWIVRRVAGLDEVALRLPSVLGMGAAAWFVFALGRRLYDAWAGAFAAVFLVSLPAVAFAASDARPYALALATTTASALALARWMETKSTRDAVLYAASTGATMLLHYVFALALAAQVVLVLYRLRSGWRVEARAAGKLAAFVALFLAPAIPTLLRVVGDRGLLSNPYRSTPVDVASYLLPSAIVYPLGIALAVGAVAFGARLRRSGYVAGTLPFLLTWGMVPALVLYELSKRTPTNVFVPRYTTMVLPALALLAGVAIRQLRHLPVQVALVVLVAVLGARHFRTETHTNEDWRAAAEAQRNAVDDPSTPVLLFSGFIEASRVEWLQDPERADYVNAPAAMYPMEGRLIPTPFSLDEPGTAYMETVTEQELLPAQEFVLVTRGADPYKGWLDPRVGEHGFVGNLVGIYGDVIVYEYTRA